MWHVWVHMHIYMAVCERQIDVMCFLQIAPLYLLKQDLLLNPELDELDSGTQGTPRFASF